MKNLILLLLLCYIPINACKPVKDEGATETKAAQNKNFIFAGEVIGLVWSTTGSSAILVKCDNLANYNALKAVSNIKEEIEAKLLLTLPDPTRIKCKHLLSDNISADAVLPYDLFDTAKYPDANAIDFRFFSNILDRKVIEDLKSIFYVLGARIEEVKAGEKFLHSLNVVGFSTLAISQAWVDYLSPDDLIKNLAKAILTDESITNLSNVRFNESLISRFKKIALMVLGKHGGIGLNPQERARFKTLYANFIQSKPGLFSQNPLTDRSTLPLNYTATMEQNGNAFISESGQLLRDLNVMTGSLRAFMLEFNEKKFCVRWTKECVDDNPQFQYVEVDVFLQEASGNIQKQHITKPVELENCRGFAVKWERFALKCHDSWMDHYRFERL